MNPDPVSVPAPSPILVDCRHTHREVRSQGFFWHYRGNQLPNLFSGMFDPSRLGTHTIPDGHGLYNGLGLERLLVGLTLAPIEVMYFLLRSENQHLIPRHLWVDGISICFWSKYDHHGEIVIKHMSYEFGEWREVRTSLSLPSRLGLNVAVELPLPAPSP